MRKRLAAVIARARPRTPKALWHFVRAAYGLAVPRRAVCPGHVAPLEYLRRAILEPGRDLVVWASRGGAKTELGSVAAHLDSVLRPGCQTRILGGSLEQSEKMYKYLGRKMRGVWAAYLAREPTMRRMNLANGSAIEVLTQSGRSVRGQRVHRLKCDEVDEFSPAVWQAAQFVTQSGQGSDGRWIPAQMEVFSTMHRPTGLMAELVERLQARGETGGGGSNRDQRSRLEEGASFEPPALRAITAPPVTPALLVWCLWEVIERCPPERSCSRCPLWPDCEGRARQADGYFPIDDAIAQRWRASREAWESEMLCRRPRADRLVFADFDPARHVAQVGYRPDLPLYRALDFGYANPFVCLWVQVEDQCRMQNAECRTKDQKDKQTADVDLSGVQVRVLAEYVERERPIAEHLRAMRERDPGPVAATFADPAGWQRSDVTGTGPCQELARAGLRVRTPRAGILEGVELLRRLLKERAAGEGPGLVVDPSCRWLVRALQEYHWNEAREGALAERPAKDGADHPIDALRYLLTGLFLRPGRMRRRAWW
ncbi:MAG: hypothetical protein WBE06_08050 [Phycisphaerae bacterium]